MRLLATTSSAILCISAATFAHADAVMECSAGLGSQVEIADCLAEVEDNVDAAVDTALGFANDAASELDDITERENSVPALAAGQAAWSAYRDQHCEFVGTTFGGGSGTGIAIRGCRIELGRIRTSELMQFSQ